MSDDTKPSEAVNSPPRFVESEGIAQTHVINDAFGFAYIGGLFDVVLTTMILAPDQSGALAPHNLVATRIRFDLDLAKAIRARLDTAVQALTPPTDQKPN